MTNAIDLFRAYLGECPLVAIIRGVTPDEAEAIGDALHGAGIRIIEVPLNSPDPFVSIEKLSTRLAGRALVGAGTVLDAAQVARVAAAGGGLVVSPNVHVPVIEATAAAGMVAAPGYFTPSEAFDALRAGAHALKLFPAEAVTPAVVRAQRAVLPGEVPLLIVGGVRPDNMRPFLDAGANGFGLGSGLFKPGRSADEVGRQAQSYVQGLRE
jgi:2-dehydro-3-deoxyphosphogalactonate aldolase